MAALLVRATNPATPTTDQFVDDDGSVFEVDIARLAGAGITRGCNPPVNDRYCPDEPVTRSQMASLLARAFTLPASTTDPFGDDDGSPHEADIAALAAAGVTHGCAPDRFCPDQPVRRDEMASFLARALGLAPMVPPPGFFGSVAEIDPDLAQRMSASWRPGCPVPLSDLRYVSVDHWGFDGGEHRGELVVHTDWAGDVLAVFERFFEERFPIERMALVDDYGGDDLASMEANNTSGFNCRPAQGSTSWSEHAYGRAIDVNPVQNPYVAGATVLPDAGRDYLDRSDLRQGMVTEVVVAAFADIGWEWGGDWETLSDWQHFSATGR
jgi:hypothetical protein